MVADAAPGIFVVGAGGHARVVVAAIEAMGGYELAGVLDRGPRYLGETVGGSRIVGTWDDLPAHLAAGARHLALAIGDNDDRAEMFERVRALGFSTPAIRHSAARVDARAVVGDGSLLCIGSILAAEVVIGVDAIVNTGAIVDHECRIGDHAHIAPGCRLGGRVKVGSGTFIGIGTSVRDGITIGARTIVGAGSVVVGDLPDGVVAYGVPARVHRERARG